MRKLLALAMSASLILPGIASAAAKPPVSLAKTSKWEINYDEDSCSLFAKFGTGKQETILKLTRFQPGTYFDLTLYGGLFRTLDDTLPLEIGFVPAFGSTRQMGTAGTSGNKLPLAIFTSLRLDGWNYRDNAKPPAITPQQEAAITAIEFKRLGQSHRLETGSMGAPMQAMRACLTNLIEHWGFDSNVQLNLSQLATPLDNPGDWVRSSDFPLASIERGHNGLVQFRLDLDEAGQVGGCRVLFRTSPDDFADLTCKLLQKRARMSAALDAAGKPVKSFYIGRVRWLAFGH